MTIQRNIALIEDTTYAVTWTDDTDGSVILSIKAAINENDDIERIADQIWLFHQSPQPHSTPDPADIMTLTEYKKYTKDLINAYRDNLINGGYIWSGHLYDSDDTARANVTSVSTAIANGIQLPSNFTWRTKDNQNVQMNAEQVVTFGVSMMNWVSQLYGVSWYHKDMLDAVDANGDPLFSTNEQVKNYNYEIGWPTA